MMPGAVWTNLSGTTTLYLDSDSIGDNVWRTWYLTHDPSDGQAWVSEAIVTQIDDEQHIEWVR